MVTCVEEEAGVAGGPEHEVEQLLVCQQGLAAPAHLGQVVAYVLVPRQVYSYRGLGCNTENSLSKL